MPIAKFFLLPNFLKKWDTSIPRDRVVDSAKGMGIILVVVWHICEVGHAYVFWFHMPLFFFISGCLYTTDTAFFLYFKKKVYHLLIPYFSFLFIFSIPDVVVCFRMSEHNETYDVLGNLFALTKARLYGGRDLYGWFDICWFVTCLFLTQQLYHGIQRLSKNKIIIHLFIVTCFGSTLFDALGNPLPLPLFWSLNTVPMALVFFHFGRVLPRSLQFNSKVFYLSLGFFLVLLLSQAFTTLNHQFNMKWNVYGIPGLNIMIGLSGSVMVLYCSHLLTRCRHVQNIMIFLGRNSMIIMFFHVPVIQIIGSKITRIFHF